MKSSVGIEVQKWIGAEMKVKDLEKVCVSDVCVYETAEETEFQKIYVGFLGKAPEEILNREIYAVGGSFTGQGIVIHVLKSGKVKVNKSLLYKLVKKYSPYELPRMRDVEFGRCKGTFYLGWLSGGKVCNVMFEEFRGNFDLYIRIVDTITGKVLYDKVLHPSWEVVERVRKK